MKKITFVFLSIIIAFTFFSCKPKQKASAGLTADNFLKEYIDTTVRPGDDFFKYSMGKWVKDNPIPETENSWGIWKLVNEETLTRLREINEEAASAKAAKGTNEQKIGDWWYTGMDTAAIESQGIKPLQPELDMISNIKTTADVVIAVASLQTIGVSALCGIYPGQDEMNSAKFVIHLYQGGIGLPDRDYYFDTDGRTKNIREEYVKHVAKMLTMMGQDSTQSKTDAATIMRMETDLAKASRKLADLRDPYANYNKFSVDGVSKLTPSLDWKNFFEVSGVKDIDTVIVGQPEFFKQVEKSLKTESVDNWKTYLRWNLINTFADKLSSNFDKQNFYFYGTVLNGTKAQRPRWKRVLDDEEKAMGFMLGQLYVQKYYSPKVKARYDLMVDNVLAAYKERIEKLDWMSDSTKQKAYAKLGTVMKKVGYPDKWRDYSTLEIDRSSYVRNAIRANKWATDFYLAKIGKPVDRTEWEMTPQTWNAYYNPSNNEIVLPAAAFIVPGMPDSLVDDAIMYGYAAGSTIGHEITHGFDDQGSQFDDQGNLKEWWTKEDREKFQQRCQGIINQFNNYVVLDSLQINGDATQGENIADLGGMLIGLDAFKKTDQFKEGKVIGGFTPLQRYFLGFALSWYGHFRDATIAMRVKTDVHSPNFLRVNGPVVNVDDWYTAFNIQPTDKMYVPDSLRVRIW